MAAHSRWACNSCRVGAVARGPGMARYDSVDCGFDLGWAVTPTPAHLPLPPSATPTSAQELIGALDAATATLSRRRAAVSAGSDEALALDDDLSRNRFTLTRGEVSRVERRRCGICGQDDAPGSGCAYSGRSPTPREGGGHVRVGWGGALC